jgi:hypothetical protein
LFGPKRRAIFSAMMETKEGKEKNGQKSDRQKENQSPRFKLPIHWSESEFFQTWLKLAREGQRQKTG